MLCRCRPLQLSEYMMQPKNKLSSRRRLDGVGLGIMIFLALLGGAAAYYGFSMVRSIVVQANVGGLGGLAINEGSQQDTPEPGATAKSVFPPLNQALIPTPLPWDGGSRVTMLVMGLDYRDWEAGEVPRSDSMILLSLDPVTKTAGIMSIPRDLWVTIPGFQNGKINTAYFLGEAYKVPGGGPALAVKTVENVIGMPINYYAQIDWDAFVKFIDAIGGLDINVKQDVVIGAVGGSPAVHIYQGVQTFDGAMALAYARARHTENDDFDRSRRQMDVILAVRDQIVNFYSLPRLIQQAPVLYSSLSSGIRTNMSVDEAIRLAWIAKDVYGGRIRRGIIQPPKQVTLGKSPDGLDILKPVPDEIRLLRDKTFKVGGPIPSVTGDPLPAAKQEAARISVWNGTDSADVATRTAQYLQSQGLNIKELIAADHTYDSTQIIIHNSKPFALSYLAALMKVDTNRITIKDYNPDSPIDIVLILGNDWAQQNPMP
jgi:polyisoprenyl-teichoic acid--peptidoglycan teichoic acid transferase